MRSLAVLLAVFGLSLLCSSRAVAGGDGDGKWERAHARMAELEKAIRQAEEEGNAEKAAALRAEAHVLRTEMEIAKAHDAARRADENAKRIETAQRLRQESADAERKAHELKAAGDEAGAKEWIERSGELWRKSEELLRGGEKKDGKAPPKHDMPKEMRAGLDRIQHLRQAAKHLREAGMPELAERLENEARGSEQRLKAEQAEREARARAEKEAASGARGEAGQVEALKREIEELRRMLEALKREAAEAR